MVLYLVGLLVDGMLHVLGRIGDAFADVVRSLFAPNLCACLVALVASS